MDVVSVISLGISLIFVVGAIYINIRLSKVYLKAKSKASQ